MVWSQILDVLMNTSYKIYTNFGSIFSTFTTPINQLPLGQSALITLLLGSFPTLMSWSILDMMVGGGIFMFISYTMLKWLVGLVTGS